MTAPNVPLHCCDMLRENGTLSCDQHTNPHDCPDVLLVWSAQHQEWGLPVRDGGSSWIAIRFCPWCATDLPVRPCSCGGDRWVDDENWSPEYPREWDGTRWPEDGRIPCGRCNHGGWDVPDPLEERQFEARRLAAAAKAGETT